MQTLGQCSFACKKIKELLPHLDYDKNFNLVEKISPQEYKKILALAFNKKIKDLEKIIKELGVYYEQYETSSNGK